MSNVFLQQMSRVSNLRMDTPSKRDILILADIIMSKEVGFKERWCEISHLDTNIIKNINIFILSCLRRTL